MQALWRTDHQDRQILGAHQLQPTPSGLSQKVMTPKQTKVYWAAWGAVRRADPAADRHELHRRAFGYDRSSKTFNTTTDFDAIMAVFRSISDPANLNAQLRPHKQQEQRLLHVRMHHLALLQALGIEHAEAYLSTILKNRFKVDFISDLGQGPTRTRVGERGPSELKQYVYTVSRAIDRLRTKKGWSQHDLYTRAHLQCPCLACRNRSADSLSAPNPPSPHPITHFDYDPRQSTR
jgi:hypothetical protein